MIEIAWRRSQQYHLLTYSCHVNFDPSALLNIFEPVIDWERHLIMQRF